MSASLVLLAVIVLACASMAEAWSFAKLVKSRAATAAVIVGIGNFGAPGAPGPSIAAVDCTKDCFKNCVKVAPGSGEYCKESCKDYCEQPDRTGKQIICARIRFRALLYCNALQCSAVQCSAVQLHRDALRCDAAQ
jgi:hypothetical protein